MKPADVRSEMIKGLERRLIGPMLNTSTETTWPGEFVKPKIVDATFSEPKSYPTGPWVGPNGEEVLPDPPKHVYVVVTLGPSMVHSAMEQGEEAADKLLDEAEVEVNNDGEFGDIDVSDVQTDGDGDEDVEVGEESALGAEQESIGVSIRLDNGVKTLKVRLDGGAYSELTVAQANRPWWIRRDISFVAQLSAEVSSHQDFTDGDIEVQIGIDVRHDERDTKVCTIWARNKGERTATFVEATRKTVFQVRLHADLPSEPKPYAPFSNRLASSLDLLYQTITLFSIGHGCDSRVEQTETGFRVSSVSMPVVKVNGLTPDIKKDDISYAVGMNDLGQMNPSAVAAVDRIIKDYKSWINDRKMEIPNLNSSLQSIGVDHLNECERFLTDIIDGWELVQADRNVAQCFRDASIAMDRQRVGAGAQTRAVEFATDGTLTVTGANPHLSPSVQSQWRPFQIAFILASLQKTVDENHINRDEVDVIWMPTGGGKTEAYLGLAAFVILWEKLHQTLAGRSNDQNTKVLMRYTLRLLTVQQIQRATSLICALEIARRATPDLYGNSEIRIGAWLGNKVTPGTRKAAVTQFAATLKSGKDLTFITKKCPWCGAQMGQVHRNQITGYKVVVISKTTSRVAVFCPDSNCPFTLHTVKGSNGADLQRGIPVYEVDEDVYSSAPDFVVGTVDKMARISWKPDSQRLFGLKKGVRTFDPPRLFIQDELHLIAGPLGSIDGVFEVMLEQLCKVDSGRPPILVAATATTKNYKDQVNNLYARRARVVPPPGLTIEDSFFAVKEPNSDGKIYVAICSGGHSGATNIQTNVLSILGHQAPALESAGADPDPYWTNVTFFSSRRALGLLTSAVETTLKSRLNYMNALTGIRTGSPVPGKIRFATRYIRSVSELTATSSEDVGKVLSDLEKRKTEDFVVDLCFATSMIEVGLDVSRLGLMTVIGQPKSSSQYIQVTGRVGRHHSAPGLVVTVLNSRIARDRAHYEGFTAWHERLYASVESASVTPFTTKALEKSTPSVLTAMCRIMGKNGNPAQDTKTYWANAVAELTARANHLGGVSASNLASVLHSLWLMVSDPKVAAMKWTTEDTTSDEPFAFSMGASNTPYGRPHWRILNSMRSVDQDANMKAFPASALASPGGLPKPAPTDESIEI